MFDVVDVENSPLMMVPLKDPSMNHYELDSLDPSSHYYFSVIARTAAGEGPPISKRGATLLEGGETAEKTDQTKSWLSH